MSSNQTDMRTLLAFEAGVEHERARLETKFTANPGDIFRDKDRRMEGRHFKVASVDGLYARCVMCNSTGGALDSRTTRISLRGLETRFVKVGGSRQQIDLERAVIEAAKEWRAAQLAAEAFWAESAAAREGSEEIYIRQERAVAALRAAVDALLEKSHES